MTHLEALKSVKNILDGRFIQDDFFEDSALKAIKDVVTDALDTPMTNFDRFGHDRNRLIEACLRERGLLVTEDFKEAFLDWLFEPYNPNHDAQLLELGAGSPSNACSTIPAERVAQ